MQELNHNYTLGSRQFVLEAEKQIEDSQTPHEEL